MDTMNYKTLLKDIKVFIFDVDGVLTDGKVFISKEEYVRSIQAKDAYAIQYAAKLGYKVFIITGGYAPSLNERLLNLGVHEVCCKSKNKWDSFTYLSEKYQFTASETLYIGDDLPDYVVMKQVKVAACPQDAVSEIKKISHYQSPFLGGNSCVRDVIEQTLKVQDNWMKEFFFEW